MRSEKQGKPSFICKLRGAKIDTGCILRGAAETNTDARERKRGSIKILISGSNDEMGETTVFESVRQEGFSAMYLYVLPAWIIGYTVVNIVPAAQVYNVEQHLEKTRQGMQHRLLK